jgi:alpha-mannosidase
VQFDLIESHGPEDDRTEIQRRLFRVYNERLLPAVYRAALPLNVRRWDVSGEPVPVTEALVAPFKATEVGDRWGPAWGTTWFELSGSVPGSWKEELVEGVVDLGFDSTRPGFSAEGLVYRPDGTPIKGLHPYNRWFPVDPGDGNVRVLVEAAANPALEKLVPTGAGDLATSSGEPIYVLRQAQLAIVDSGVRALVADLDVLGQLAAQLPIDDPRGAQVWAGISDALDILNLNDISGTAAAARTVLEPLLAKRANASAHQVSAVGHAHIDSAWLWPLREAVRKVARTCSNVTQLMDDYPELIFAMSQAQQLAWIEEHYPAVFSRVREKIETGQFVPVGGMWVEADTNMPGGEAMARHFLHGKRYFAERFGVDTAEVWLPDSFGFSAALPQLIALSGSRYFLTQKLSWNKTNRFPHHTFLWEGLDGTRIFTHFPPVATYNSDLSGTELALASRQFSDRARANHSLVPFGWGDGGGGPTREMLERARRTADLEGSPQVRIEAPAAFFARAEVDYADPPVWWGELYLELHRGTYTSQAGTKQGNRRSEHLLREAELWATTATIRTGAAYPYAELDRLWKRVLLHQFHDILPGSSIAWVNREARATYEEVANELNQLITNSLEAIEAVDQTEWGVGEVAFNAAPYPRAGVPALAAAPVTTTKGAASVERDGDGFLLINSRMQVRLNLAGLITAVIDNETGRDAIAPGAYGNLLQLHPDVPNDWDAWDVDSFYRHTRTDLVSADSSEVVELDEGVAGVRTVRRYGTSTFDQLVTLAPESAALNIQLDVDWRERETFLKASFGLDVRAEVSSSETQFGHVNRPTHENTSWDAAKFEICAHRFIHVAEPGYGVALVNDSTYGHDVSRAIRPDDGGTTTTVRLSLLRAPLWPDPQTDQGHHRLRYGIVPAANVLDAVREGYAINLPLRTIRGVNAVAPLIALDSVDVVVEAVKLAEDQSGDVLVRLYAASGGRAEATVRTAFPVRSVQSVDLLERPLDIGQTWADPTAATVCFRPFQIVTLRYSRSQAD